MAAAASRVILSQAVDRLCLRHVIRPSATSAAALRFGSPASAVKFCRNFQFRHQSTSQTPKNDPKKTNPPPPLTLGQLLHKLLNFRPLLNALTPQEVKKSYRENPAVMWLALFMLAGSAGIFVYVIKIYFEYFQSRQFTRFPDPIANSLRRALYYTNISPDPKMAGKYYKKALVQCNELQLDPLSDDVMGIRIQMAAWLEKIGEYQAAIFVLDSILGDCLKWVAVMEKSIADGSVDSSGRPPAVEVLSDDQSPTIVEDVEEYAVENLWHKRSRLLAKAVGISTKLGALHSDEHVLEPENAHARLAWAVETALSESQRRQKEGVKKEEGPWMSPIEIGGAMESLAQHYESKSNFELAVPLFFHALRLCTDPCHRVTIMNNLAAAFAQHPPYISNAHAPITLANSDVLAVDMPKDRAGFLEAAKNWAHNAYSHAKDVRGGERTEECDEACAVALTNMGDIAALQGNKEDARKRFHEAIEMSKKIGFEPGITQAEAGLQKL